MYTQFTLDTLDSSDVTGGGVAECPPDIFHWEILGDLLGKERLRKLKNGEEKKENCKREGGKLKIMEGKKYDFKWAGDLLKPLKFVWGLTKMKLLLEKAFEAGKKSEKVTLPPLENIPLSPLLDSQCLILVPLLLLPHPSSIASREAKGGCPLRDRKIGQKIWGKVEQIEQNRE